MNTARKKAEAAKAPRAAVSEYTLAENKRAEAMRLYGEKKYLEAYQASEEAVAAYNRSIEIAEQKRLAAEKKLSDAAQEQEVTSSRLEEVSKEIGGGNP